MKKFIYSIFIVSLFFMTTGCSEEDSISSIQFEENNLALIEQLAIISNTDVLFKNSSSKESPRPQPTIWVDCDTYSGIVVPATFKPESDPFDELYVMPGNMFYNGVPLISDSKPGDQDYNGGRWHLNVLKADVDASKYANACSEEDLDLNDFDSTTMYFGCPLRPKK